jgi:hypothetical protein
MNHSTKTNSWLYGEGIDVEPIPEEIANQRIKLLQEHLEVLVETEYTDRDNIRVNDVIKAIKYWKKLKTNEGI